MVLRYATTKQSTPKPQFIAALAVKKMSTHYTVVDDFVSRWNKSESLAISTLQEIHEIESILEIKFNECYGYLVTKYGDLYTPDLLDEIVDKELELNDIQNFIHPTKMIEDTKAYESAGMPKGYIAFASDCMGNMFCFKLDECRTPQKESSVWFFDHYFVEMEKISSTFSEWLSSYVIL